MKLVCKRSLTQNLVLGAVYLVLALALAYGGFLLLVDELLQHRAAESGSPVTVDLPKGAGIKKAAVILEKAGVIGDPFWFELAARLGPKRPPIQPGEYRLNPAMSYESILEAMSQGRVVLHSLAIPEGFTLKQIAQRIKASGLVDGDKFYALAGGPKLTGELSVPAGSLEGYLFPDTYHIPRGLAARALIGLMYKRFLKAWAGLADRARAQGLSRHQVVTLASIIEREAKKPGERAQISAVYHNRLRKHMRLQADPTVIYGIKDFDGNLTKRDLETDTPYNTYTRAGLPPGPICSPGAASLRAAVYPAQSPALYFVARGDGSHHFSKTYQEHNRAVRRYQLRRRSKALPK